ncbi:NAD-dependent alcohol dehydrogenase, partial [Bacillus sp. PsM16]|nr:NAD-dependent alcohol dehydrogenase [Bacillus sp. PsM16]
NMKIESMQKFNTFEIPTFIHHVIVAVKHVLEEVKAYCVSKVLLVTDPGNYLAGVVDPLIDSLKEAQIDVVLFN